MERDEKRLVRRLMSPRPKTWKRTAPTINGNPHAQSALHLPPIGTELTMNKLILIDTPSEDRRPSRSAKANSTFATKIAGNHSCEFGGLPRRRYTVAVFVQLRAMYSSAEYC